MYTVYIYIYLNSYLHCFIKKIISPLFPCEKISLFKNKNSKYKNIVNFHKARTTSTRYNEI